MFIQLEPKIKVEPEKKIKIKNLASIHCGNKKILNSILNIDIVKVPIDAKNKVITVIDIINKIKNEHNNIDIVVFGEPEILVDIDTRRNANKVLQKIKVMAVSTLLFLGAAIAIINFHEDVNMENSLKSIYYLVTGEKVSKPLILQIPYSLGLGVGMLTFFNHTLKKKWKREPSPLELEMYMYKKNIDDYVLNDTKHTNGGN